MNEYRLYFPTNIKAVMFFIVIILIVCGVWGYDGLSCFTLHISRMFEFCYCQFLQETLQHVVNSHPSPSFFFAPRRSYHAVSYILSCWQSLESRSNENRAVSPTPTLLQTRCFLVDNVLGQSSFHSKIEWKLQMFPIHFLPPYMHSIPSSASCHTVVHLCQLTGLH